MNYATILSDPVFLTLLARTLLYTALAVVANRTVKEATIKAFQYPDLDSLKAHVLAFV